MALNIEEKTLYRMSEIRDGLGVSKATLRKEMRDGRLKGSKVGRELVVYGADLMAWVKMKRKQPLRRCLVGEKD